MADSPATFRLSPDDRALLEAVAHATGQTLSAYVREAALAAARAYVAREGIETILERDRAYIEAHDHTARRIADHEKILRERLTNEGGS